MRVAIIGEFKALLVNEPVTDATPLVRGVNDTVKFALWPAAIVRGKERPLMENSELPGSIEETVTPAPVAVSVPRWLPLMPTTTLPTLNVPGLKLN